MVPSCLNDNKESVYQHLQITLEQPTFQAVSLDSLSNRPHNRQRVYIYITCPMERICEKSEEILEARWSSFFSIFQRSNRVIEHFSIKKRKTKKISLDWKRDDDRCEHGIQRKRMFRYDGIFLLCTIFYVPFYFARQWIFFTWCHLPIPFPYLQLNWFFVLIFILSLFKIYFSLTLFS